MKHSILCNKNASIFYLLSDISCFAEHLIVPFNLKFLLNVYLIVLVIIIWRAKLLKYDWLMRMAFFLNSGQKLLDPDWLIRFILSIRTKYQK